VVSLGCRCTSCTWLLVQLGVMFALWAQLNSMGSCRMVLAMTPVCIIGVVLCLKPSFIFGGKQRLNTAGVIAALLQAFVGSLVKVRFV
jgi:hypothetical protein